MAAGRLDKFYLCVTSPRGQECYANSLMRIEKNLPVPASGQRTLKPWEGGRDIAQHIAEVVKAHWSGSGNLTALFQVGIDLVERVQVGNIVQVHFQLKLLLDYVD